METTKPPLDQIQTHATQVLDYRLNIDAEYQGWILIFTTITCAWLFCLPASLLNTSELRIKIYDLLCIRTHVKGHNRAVVSPMKAMQSAQDSDSFGENLSLWFKLYLFTKHLPETPMQAGMPCKCQVIDVYVEDQHMSVKAEQPIGRVFSYFDPAQSS
ncbi:hypothetical protein AK812_SmicGene39660 [Symbiodinium microadriaticum]|uniref:Uncharacterized protein n=1 Tax=Symbiodinium microadriaticum TaxID=2951 RepID=A0A1Q9CAM3_SYMMI|nr:hypothetical protein AK812_SmicGene39660 [Symbiodinium microadriaticum]